VRRIYLLTQTAEAFFTRFFAFQTTTRDAVDTAVRQSVEFIGVCPCQRPRGLVLEIASAHDNPHKGATMSDSIVDAVRSRYGGRAESSLSNDHAGVRAVAEAFGYTPEELAAIPKDANMGLSCGNPTAMASLKPGETVGRSGLRGRGSMSSLLRQKARPHRQGHRHRHDPQHDRPRPEKRPGRRLCQTPNSIWPPLTACRWRMRRWTW